MGVRVWGLGCFFQVYGSGFVGFRIWGFRGVGVSGFRGLGFGALHLFALGE